MMRSSVGALFSAVVGGVLGFGLSTIMWTNMLSTSQQNTREALDQVDAALNAASLWCENFNAINSGPDYNCVWSNPDAR